MGGRPAKAGGGTGRRHRPAGPGGVLGSRGAVRRLPHRQGHGRRGHRRTGPHPRRQPADDRRRHARQHPDEPRGLGPQSAYREGRCRDARLQPYRRAARRGGRVPGDARMTDALGPPRSGVDTPLVEEPITHEALDRLFADPPGLWGQLTGVQNDKIGARLMLTGFFFLLLGGSFDSVLMRLQLAVPENDLLSPQLYNELFTNHGTVTMFLVILPIFEGFAILLLPLLLGTRELPFPRLGAFSYWALLFGGLLYYSSTLFQLVPDAGWFAYTPLSGPDFSPDLALDFWVLGLGVAEVGAIAAALDLIIGICKMRAPVFTRRRMVGHTWLIAAFVAIGFLSFGLWAHHMFAVGLPPLILSFFAAASMTIAIPAGVQIFAWLATIWEGRAVFATPFLFVIGFLAIFVLGGITGVMVAAPPFDLQAHDSHFVVAHLHYVLIGGVAFPIFAGVYYWFGKFTGKMLDERLGRWNFWLLFIGVHAAFLPMPFAALLGMPRRIYTYDSDTGWGIYNLISTTGVVLFIVPGIAIFIWNVVRSLRRGEPAPANPWGGDTLEWAVPSPPAQHGWSVLPIVHSRNPLWDQDSLHRGDERLERFVRALADWPLRWRAAVTVGTADARPQEVFRIADPSIWPLVTAVGLVVTFIGELTKVRFGIPLGALVMVVGAIAWNWPTEEPMTIENEEAFEREHHVPVNAGGSVVVAAWGMGLAILFLAIAFASLLLSYFYLRLENPQWPARGIADPDLTLPLVAAALVLLAGAIGRGGLRRLIADDQPGFIRGLIGGLVVGSAAIVVQIVDL